MSLGELLLTVIIAVVVLGPKQWPSIAHYAGTWLKHLHRIKHRATAFLQQQTQAFQLQDNIKKAEQADMTYHQED